jgi:putative nucleotidyltransferase with HDIG domain
MTVPRFARFGLRVFAVGIVYAALNLLAARFELAFGVSMIYPASAAGVVAGFLWPAETGVAVFAATLATPWHPGDPVWLRLCFALGNTVEALLPALALSKRRARETDMRMLFRVLWWACIANTLSNFVIATAPQVAAGRVALDRSLLVEAAAWWAADGLAIAVFAFPLALRLSPERFFENPEILSWAFLRSWRTLAGAGAATLLVSAAILVCDLYLPGAFNWPALLYLIPICWLMLEGGLPGSTTATAVVAFCYLVTLGLEARTGMVEPLRSPERLVVVHGNLFVFYFFSVFAGAIRTRNQLLIDRLRKSWEGLRRSFDATVTAFAAAVEARDPRTQEHLGRVSQLAAETARRMGLSGRQVELVRYGAILHDIGKIAVPSEILAKKEPLTADEMAMLQAHADIGAKMLEKTGLLEEAIPLVRYHEERWDGSVEGPFAASYGLAGEDIPLGARIIAVADAWDAMVSDRPYRPTPGPSAAAAELSRQAGKQFDPAVVRVFLQLLGEEGLLESGERAQAPFES